MQVRTKLQLCIIQVDSEMILQSFACQREFPRIFMCNSKFLAEKLIKCENLRG